MLIQFIYLLVILYIPNSNPIITHYLHFTRTYNDVNKNEIEFPINLFWHLFLSRSVPFIQNKKGKQMARKNQYSNNH